jgi:hypothetical protein
MRGQPVTPRAEKIIAVTFTIVIMLLTNIYDRV